MKLWKLVLAAVLFLGMTGIGTAQTDLESDGYEDGDYSEWSVGVDDTNAQVVQSPVYEESYSLEMDLVSADNQGIFRQDNQTSPDKITVYVKAEDVSSGNYKGVQYSINGYSFGGSGSAVLKIQILNGELQVNKNTVSTALSNNTWHKIQLTDINWSSDEVDEVYLDGSRVASNVGFNDGISANYIEYSETYIGGRGSGTAYFDNIDYTVEKQLNTLPSFNSFSTTPSSWTLDEAVDFSYNVSDSDGNISNVTLEVFNATSGNQLKEETFQYSSSSVTDTQVDWFTPSSTGNYTVYFTATDDQGSSSVETLDKTVEDTVPPDVIIYSPENSTYSSSNVSLDVSANESVDSWKYALDDLGNTSFSPNTTLEDLGDGQHSILVYATDSSGNTGSESVSFSVDTTSPTSTDNWTATGFVDRTDPGYTLVEISASDSGSGVANITYDTGEGETTVTGSTTTLNLTGSKNYTVEYYATDTNGNVEATNTEYVATYKKNISTSEQKQDNSSTSDLATQYVFKEKQVDVLGTAKPENVTVNSVSSINGSCTNCNTRYLSYSPWMEDFESYSQGGFTELYGSDETAEWVHDSAYANGSTAIIPGQVMQVNMSENDSRNNKHYLYRRLENPDILSKRTFSYNLSVNDTAGLDALILSNSKHDYNPSEGVRIGLQSTGEFEAYSGASGAITKPITSNTDYYYRLQVTVDGRRNSYTAKIFDKQGTEMKKINGSFQADQLKYATIFHDGTAISAKYDNIEIGKSSRQVQYYNASGDFVSHTNISSFEQLSLLETNLTRQKYSKTTDLSLSGGLKATNLTLDVNSLCDQVNEFALDSDTATSDQVNNCIYAKNTGDFISETELDFKPPPGELFIEETYTGTRKLETENLVDVEFSGVKTNVATPSSCTPTNLTKINVSANEYTNRTTGFSCNTGSRNTDYSLVQTFDVNQNNDTQYWFNGSFNINSVETENNTLVWEFNKSNLTDWSQKKSGTVSGLIDGRGKDINVRGKTDTVELVVGTNHSNSSLENGTYTSSLGYKVDDNDTTIIYNSGGGGGSTTIIREVFGNNYSWTVSSAMTDLQLAGYPTRDFTRVLTVENTGDRRVPINVSCTGDSELCRSVEISDKNFTLERGGSQEVVVSGRIPASHTQKDFPVDFAVRFNDPSFDSKSDPNSGVAYVDFRFTYSPFQGAIINSIFSLGSKLSEWREIPSPTGFGNPVPYPFLLLPTLLSVLIFLLGEGADRAFAKTSHRNFTALVSLAMFFVFYVAL